MVTIKRIYEQASKDDGFRVLVDRLWPRGISKEDAALDEWLKEVGPSDELRKWFGHDPARFAEFEKRYKKELLENEAFEQLKNIAKQHDNVTLLYGAHDPENNQARVLRDMLTE